MELVCEAKVLLVHKQCPKCGKGLMLEEETDMNVVYATNPPQFNHRCNECGHEETYCVTYPYQKLVPVEELREPTQKEIGGMQEE